MKEKSVISKKIEIPQKVEYENYCDFMLVSHKLGGFLIHFGQTITKPPRMLVRIWTDPISAKSMLYALQENIRKYEEKFGEIKIPPTEKEE